MFTAWVYLFPIELFSACFNFSSNFILDEKDVPKLKKRQ